MIENIILSNLAYAEPFARKILPFLKYEYFTNRVNQEVFKVVSDYITKYNGMPTYEALLIDIAETTVLSDEEKGQADRLIESLKVDSSMSLEWLIDQTEQFCQKRAIHLALMKSIEIYDGKNKQQDMGAIPSILQEALSVSFDTNIGHDFFEDAFHRFEFYHLEEFKIPFGLDLLNQITKGGVSKKTLTIFYGGVNVGKTFVMCSLAADNIREGKNVLYITLEMSQEMIAHRIEANLFDADMDDISKIPESIYLEKVKRVKQRYGGNLIVKEFPTAQAGVGNFRYLLNELKLKKGFVPDIIYVDYLNICNSSRISKSKSGLYEYVGSISQELRGLAVEMDLPIITATQFNREGFKSSNPGLEDVSESFGVGMIADLVLGLIRTDELDSLKQIKVMQLKTRYMFKGDLPVFVLGADIKKMKLHNVDDKEQTLSSSPTEKVNINGFEGIF